MNGELIYPMLSEEGKEEVTALIEDIKNRARKVVDDAIGELYPSIPDYIESDSWTNFRNTLLQGLCDYKNAYGPYRYDYQRIRQAIFEQFKAELIKDLNQDFIEENERLKKTIAQLEETRSR